MPGWKPGPGLAWPIVPGESDDFYDHLVRVCLLLLLHELPGACRDLRDRLRPLGFDQTPTAVEGALGALVAAGLAEETSDPSAGLRSRTYAVTADGRRWLSRATMDLRRTEAVLGGFLARCGERLLALT